MGVMCLEFATPGIGLISAEGGAEFILFDMEHNGWSLETVRTLIASCRGSSITPFVRIPTLNYDYVAHVLDVGASGVIVPQVATREQAENAVRFAKYPPHGVRGASFAMAHDDYQGGDLKKKMAHANEQSLVCLQIESVEGVNNVEAIAAVQDVDVLWIGQFDLTTSMGIPGEFTDPRFVDAVDRITAACKANNVAMALGGMNPDELAAAPSKGYQLLIYSGDLWIYQQALTRCFEKIRSVNG